jgi:hypothetical protein
MPQIYAGCSAAVLDAARHLDLPCATTPEGIWDVLHVDHGSDFTSNHLD